MTSLDLGIVLVYVLGLFAFAIFTGLRESIDDFLILSRRANVVLVLFSVVSTWLGVGVIVGTAASGYDTGISFALTGAVGALVAVLAAGFFAPTIKRFGDRFQAHTLGDFFGIRYSRGARALTALIITMIYLLFTAVQFNGLASLLKVWGGVGFEVAVTVTAVTTIIYTAFAGIKSDFYTDAVHFWVIALVLLGVLVPSIWISTDGLTALESLPKSYFDPFAFGGLAYFLGGIIFGVGVVFVSMELWQRIYASTDERTARRALIGSAAVVFPFYFAAALAGMAARVITPSLPDRDLALFAVMKSVLPTGVLGLGLAAFVAVFISSVNTMMMVVSATLTKDVYKTFIRPEANDKQTLLVGRALTLVSGILGLLVSYLVRDIITLSILALFLLLIFLPSVVGGFFWRRSTAKASLASILVGLISTLCALPYMPNTAFVPGFLLSVIVFVVTSLTTQHDDSETIDI